MCKERARRLGVGGKLGKGQRSRKIRNYGMGMVLQGERYVGEGRGWRQWTKDGKEGELEIEGGWEVRWEGKMRQKV